MRKEKKARGGRNRGLLMLNHSPPSSPPCNHCAARCWLYHCGPTRAEKRGREEEGGIGKHVSMATEQEHVWRQGPSTERERERRRGEGGRKRERLRSHGGPLSLSPGGRGFQEHHSPWSHPVPSRQCDHEVQWEYGGGCYWLGSSPK